MKTLPKNGWYFIKAFRESLTKKRQLDKAAIIRYTSSLYELDAALSYGPAITVGKVIHSLTKEQKSLLARLDFSNSSTWPVFPESLDKKSMSHRAHVAVMTYASELFSWYAGSVTADVYFCPERHGTYFGGFYLKDYPAMGNKGYSISTSLTGDKGEQFIELLTPVQSECLRTTVGDHKPLMRKIVGIREAVAKELRKAIAGETPDKEMVVTLIKQYGALDGELSCDYAICFSNIYHSLTNQQKEDLKKLRGLDVYPKGAYLYSDPIEAPQNLDDQSLLKD